jgi:hypothetical protein
MAAHQHQRSHQCQGHVMMKRCEEAASRQNGVRFLLDESSLETLQERFLRLTCEEEVDEKM